MSPRHSQASFFWYFSSLIFLRNSRIATFFCWAMFALSIEKKLFSLWTFFCANETINKESSFVVVEKKTAAQSHAGRVLWIVKIFNFITTLEPLAARRMKVLLLLAGSNFFFIILTSLKIVCSFRKTSCGKFPCSWWREATATFLV